MLKPLNEIRARVAANRDYANKFKFAAHDKIELIGQTSALLMCLQERCADLERLLAALELALEQRDGYRRNYWEFAKIDYETKSEIVEENDAAIEAVLNSQEGK